MMKRLSSILAIAFLLVMVNTTFPREHAVTTGIVGFYDGGKISKKSAAVSAELSEVLSRYRFITLIERANLEALVREIELGQSGLADDAAAAKAGRIRGCKILITGSISNDRVTARAIHTETAKVIAAGSAELPGVESLGKKLASGIESHLARETLRTLRNDSADIKIEFRAEAGKSRITTAGAGTVNTGDQVTFRFKSSVGGYLTIVDIQPGGDVVLLFPNDMTPSNEIKGGVEYSIPPGDAEYMITATEPRGRDTVVAFFTKKRVDWLDMEKLTGAGFRSVREGERAFTARGFSITAKNLRKSEWESAVLEIDVR